MRILVAEDDTALASFVKKGLESEHYAVDVSADGEQARAMAGELDFDLVVLDLNLPRMDGVAILRFLRTRKPSMPILVLTGRNRVEDRVQCLDLGADDYLGKPFSFTELSARIRALMRRSHMPAESVLAVDDLKLDRVERRVERAGRRIELTSKEFCLLEYLMRNAGRRITRAMIIEHVWNLSFDTCTNVVDVYVNYSAFSAALCGSDTVPVADSVARVTARFSRVVTWASEPSATCNSPTIIGIPCRLRQGGNVGVQTVGNRKACGVICAAVDARSRRQLEQRFLQIAVCNRQLVLRSQRRNVIQYTECHLNFSLELLSWLPFAGTGFSNRL